MKRKGYWKRVLAHILCVCMIVLSVCGTNMNIVQAEETKETTTVYFLNSEGWDEVGGVCLW